MRKGRQIEFEEKPIRTPRRSRKGQRQLSVPETPLVNDQVVRKTSMVDWSNKEPKNQDSTPLNRNTLSNSRLSALAGKNVFSEAAGGATKRKYPDDGEPVPHVWSQGHQPPKRS